MWDTRRLQEEMTMSDSALPNVPGPFRAWLLDDYIEQQMAQYHIPGLSVAALKDGEVLALKGYGVASVEFDLPADQHTVYHLGKYE